MTAERKELDARRQDRASLRKRRNALLEELSGLRNERFRERKQIATRLTHELEPAGVEVTVIQDGDRTAYLERLKELFPRSTATVEHLAGNLAPVELADLVERNDAALLAERAGMDVDKAAKAIEVLAADGKYREIESVDPADLPRFTLLDNGVPKPLPDLSTGQRCTTILPILLLESRRPLLIDQPEDNLDKEFLFGLVVARILVSKTQRQLIFVTHDPSVVVLGDADRVFAMRSDGKHGRVDAFGDVEEMKDRIVRLLEGGKEAFQERLRRYGY